MRKLFIVIVSLLFAIASCTKKAAPTSAKADVAIDAGSLFAQNCSKCHGATGVEGRAPNLAKNEMNKNELVDKISNGGGRMPSFSGKLSAKQIGAVAEFVMHLKK